jgi:ankyrin repeat protein
MDAAVADVNYKDYVDNALIAAAYEGHTDIVKLLIDAGAGVNNTSIRYGTITSALLIAIDGYNSTTKIMKLLIDAGADVNYNHISTIDSNMSGKTPLIAAVYMGHTNKFRLLIDAGADVNYVDSRGDTALILAAFNDRPKIVKLLINAGADINHINSFGDTALTRTSRYSTVETLLLLIEAGADLNYVDPLDEYTALMKASERRNPEMVELLIDAGADVNYVNSRGDTALTLAEKFKGTDEGGEIVEILKPSETGRVDTAITNSFLDDKIFLIMAAVTGIIGLVSDMPIYVLLPIVIANLIGSFLEGSFLEDKMMQGTP